MNLIELSLVCFGGGAVSPPPPPDVLGDDDPSVKAEKEAAAKKERELARKRKGRRSTILTSGLGVPGSPLTSQGQIQGGTW